MASLVLWIVLNNPPVGRLANNLRHADPSFSAPRNKMLRGDIVACQQFAANLGHQFLKHPESLLMALRSVYQEVGSPDPRARVLPPCTTAMAIPLPLHAPVPALRRPPANLWCGGAGPSGVPSRH